MGETEEGEEWGVSSPPSTLDAECRSFIADKQEKKEMRIDYMCITRL